MQLERGGLLRREAVQNPVKKWQVMRMGKLLQGETVVKRLLGQSQQGSWGYGRLIKGQSSTKARAGWRT
jgi:hypothetical protein